MHGLVVYKREGRLFACDLSLDYSEDSFTSFWLILLQCFFLLFYWSLFYSLCKVFDVLSKIYRLPSVNPSGYSVVFGDSKVRHRDWLTCSGGSDRLGELWYNFTMSNDLTQTVNFPTRIPDCDSPHPALKIYFNFLILAFIL